MVTRWYRDGNEKESGKKHIEGGMKIRYEVRKKNLKSKVGRFY